MLLTRPLLLTHPSRPAPFPPHLQVDDIFLSTNVYNITLNRPAFELPTEPSYRISGSDVLGFVAFQRDLNARLPAGSKVGCLSAHICCAREYFLLCVWFLCRSCLRVPAFFRWSLCLCHQKSDFALCCSFLTVAVVSRPVS